MKRLNFFIPVILIFFITVLIFSVTVSHAQNFGSNWTANFFNNTDLSGAPVVSRFDAQVNFNFGTSSPSPGLVNSDNFSIRWSSLENFEAGTYRFTAGADDGIRVFFDDQLIIDNFGNRNTFAIATADRDVAAGSHEIVVEYVEIDNVAQVQFFWEAIAAATAGPTPTPSATGLPPIPPGALTATVIRAGVLNVRDAPSLGGNVISRILRGQTYQVVGRNENATWFLLELGGVQGWSFGFYLFVNGNEFTAPVRSASTVFGIPAGFVDTGVLAQTQAVMKMRAEPNVLSPQTGRITWGAFLPVVGRTAGGDWYQVLWKGTIGWVFTGFTEIIQGDLNDVPVVR